MKLGKLLFISFTLSCICASSGYAQSIDKPNYSALIFKMNYNSMGLRGFGGKLTVRNVETNEVYKSKSKMGFNPFIVIEDLPIGIYETIELEILTGGPILILRDRRLFNQIKIDTAKNYYLGNYLTKKIKPLFKYNIDVTCIENDPQNKVSKQLKKKDSKWLTLDTDFDQKLFRYMSTEIQIQ